MISRLFLLFTLAVISFTFTSHDQHSVQLPQPSKLSFPATCPQRFIDLAKAAIITCQKDKLPDTTDCVADEMKKYKLQCWNVLVKTSEDVADIVSYWAPGACIVKLDNYGQLFNRSYLLWQSLNYNNDANFTEGEESHVLEGQESQQVYYKYTEGLENYNQPKNQQLYSQDHKQFSNLQGTKMNSPIVQSSNHPDHLRGDCQQWKTDAVKNLIQYCDLAGNQRSGQCIRDRIKDQMSQYWSVYIKTTINSAITIWFAECYTTLQGYGQYTRYIRVWT